MGSGQLGFAEAFLDPRLGANERLSRIDGLIDWAPLDRLVSGLRPGAVGRPPYRALPMLKALYLQAMYDLSDPGLEEALLDRLSFRRFCGFALDGGTPDATTILRYRHAAAEAGLLEGCFAEINRQLEARGLMLKKGTLLDATLVADGLISWDERAVYGDKAYPRKARRAALKAAGIKDRIARRRHKTEGPLSPRQTLRNDLIARHRAPVEGVFSQLKRFHGFARTRCLTLARNAADLFAALTVMNLKRAVHLTAG